MKRRCSALLFLVAACLCIPGLPTVLTAGETVRIYFQENAQVELAGPGGGRVLIDVHDPGLLSSPPTDQDILLTTHNHADHRRLDVVRAFPGPRLDVRTGEITRQGIRVRGIASAHNEGDEFRDEGGSNYIFIIDMAGLRLAHFGDIGQAALTPGQLAALGQVDIAITQLANRFSGMTGANRKGFKLMDQVNPKLIIPTHVFEPTCAGIAARKWDAYNSYKKYATCSSETLPEKTTIVFMGNNANLTRLPYAGF